MSALQLPSVVVTVAIVACTTGEASPPRGDASLPPDAATASREAGASSDGSASCGDTTSDPRNCGACGHACRAQGVGACVNGTCAPALSGCVTEAAGFDSCAAYCQSMGEQCVAGGCATIGSPSAITWGAWDDVSLDLCLSRLAPSDTSADSCDETLDVWDDAHRFRSCCCTDG